MSFSKKILQITITLGKGEFGDQAGNTVVLVGHRATVNISAFGGESQNQMQCRIYGLPISLVNQLTTIGPIMTQVQNQNKIKIEAGEEGGILSQVYYGTIWQAWGDFNAAPDVGLNVIAYAALDVALTPITHTSVSSPTSTSSVMKLIANKAQLDFYDEGVSGLIGPTYYDGTANDQIIKCAQEGGVSHIVENNELHIWPKGGHRNDEPIVLSPGFGLVGYPTFSSQGVLIDADFSPRARIGGKVTISGSSLIPANGTWITFKATHNLSSEMPGGPWFTTLEVWNRDGQ